MKNEDKPESSKWDRDLPFWRAFTCSICHKKAMGCYRAAKRNIKSDRPYLKKYVANLKKVYL